MVALLEGRVRPDDAAGPDPEDEPLTGSLLGDAWRGPLAVLSPPVMLVVVDELVLVLVLGLRSERARARPLGGADDCIAGSGSLCAVWHGGSSVCPRVGRILSWLYC